MTVTEKKHTPMMEQWHGCKQSAPDALLLFRMGDFYEAFYQDAEVIAKELSLTLTKRQEIPMCGVPWHASDSYIDRLLAKGHKVAIAEQLEDPKMVKGLVKRGIVRILTAGSLVNSALLSEKSNNYIVAISQLSTLYGLAVCDLSTGEFFVQEHEQENDLFNELHRLQPKECLLTKKFKEKHQKALTNTFTTCLDEWSFDHKMAYSILVRHFQVQHLDGFGLKGKIASINAAGALLSYLKENLSCPIEGLRTLHLKSTTGFLSIDSNSERHLELSTLLAIIDHTLTPMGGRMLIAWLKKPLLSLSEIKKRQDAIEQLIAPSTLSRLRTPLKGIRDLERLMMKTCANLANPRDLVSLRHSLEETLPLKEILRSLKGELFSKIEASLVDVRDLILLLKSALVEEPPIRLHEGEVFREGYDEALDELKTLSRSGKDWLLHYQNEIREETGVKNLRVVYNKIFGYTIEVSRGQAKGMGEKFEKRQTLSNCERFTTKELKEYESKVLSAEERKESLEKELFEKLRKCVQSYQDRVFSIASGVAEMDTLFSLGQTAYQNNYIRPQIDESPRLEIIEGRHPVVESVLSRECFMPNNTLLDGVEDHLMLITGPNMAGKSTYIRQVALLVILAQVGSFIPAKRAHMGIVDKIFTRIGANDDLSRGQSTFMVEMSETANILNHATSRSLVILDEIGRGTSTYDGLSIAWAVAEFLLAKKAKTLFATHYFELTALETTHAGAKNYHAAVKELQDDIVFLHKIVSGGADRSYGIHVARLAGLPLSLISRANEILHDLEQKGGRKDNFKFLQRKKNQEEQLTLF
jgi:DNA mismatch repair protein MutS